MLKSLVSHKVPNQKIADVLEFAFDFFIDKKSIVLNTQETSNQESEINNLCKDETLKINENQNKENKENKVNLPQSLRETKKQCDKKRNYIPVKTKQELFQRSGGCCEYISESGVKCHSQFKLQIYHIQTITFSGSNKIENLRHLCSSHNLHAASQMGIGYETVR